MDKFKDTVLYIIHNSILLYFANLFFPQEFVLGTHRISFLGAIIIAGLIWTIIVRRLNLTINTKSKLNTYILTWIYNFVALWITARIAPYSGFGAISFVWLIGLSLVASLVQFPIFLSSDKK
jgi:hypothetical protein